MWHPKQRGPWGEKALLVLRCGFHLHELVPPGSLSINTTAHQQPCFQGTSSWCAGENDQLLGALKIRFLSPWNCTRRLRLGRVSQEVNKTFPLDGLLEAWTVCCLPLAVSILQPELGTHAVLNLALVSTRGQGGWHIQVVCQLLPQIISWTPNQSRSNF